MLYFLHDGVPLHLGVFLFFILEAVLYTRADGYKQVLTHCWKPTHTACVADDAAVILARNSRIPPQR